MIMTDWQNGLKNTYYKYDLQYKMFYCSFIRNSAVHMEMRSYQYANQKHPHPAHAG